MVVRPASAQFAYLGNLLADLFAALILNGEEVSSSRLLWWVAEAKREQLKALLTGTSSTALLQPDAGRLLDSVRGVLSGYLRAHQRHPSGTFSIRNWLANENGNLFITWRDDQIPALRPLINCWLDLLISAVLSGTKSDRPLWIFIDELGSLEQLTGLPIDKGRHSRIVGLVGKAGTGKTTTLTTAVEALRSAGVSLLGVALSTAIQSSRPSWA